MNPACGVDFGTSNSTIGAHRPGQPLLLPLEDGKPTLPSVVFFNADENRVSFGRAALADYLEGHEGRLMRSLKSLLGSGLIDSHTEVNGRALRFRELLADFLRELKRRGEQAAGTPFERAVFGRPVHFVDDDEAADRQAEQTLREIGHAVGFRDIIFQYEPIAAAFAYEAGIEREELVLVADIGGGTSDFSLVRLGPQRVGGDRRQDILATAGVHVGGTDFDKYLSLSCAMPLLGYGTRMTSGKEVPSSYYFNLATWHTINFVYSRKIWSELQDVRRDAQEPDRIALLMQLIDQRDGHWLAMKMEEGKIALSQQAHCRLQLERLAADCLLDVRRETFDQAIGQLVDSVADAVASLLNRAGVDAGRVDTLFFTGGSSGVPLLRARIAALLPQARAVEGDLFGSIGAGLALDASRRFS
ncbi:Hsp70 family protein [Noviherbaspirillum aridicola]|uniref:Heat-shock protein n=1 Tax=Noviherbaspirillum aridicola TaxID=2849687 RepID=A0ABQ4Q6C8_9BURK|nr:Hsp70 family protein [Noviherbaspirillum aridicola]GIZ52264.1 heat-shock protein [Noviherbaspirillum aridicola]